MNQRERQTDANTDAQTGDIAAACASVLEEMRTGKYLDAQIRCRQALELNGDHPELLHLMALVYFNARELDHAVEWASRAIRNNPKPAYLTTLGVALLNLGRHGDALKVFDKAVQLRPEEARLWSNFGDALVEVGRAGEALICFQRAREIDPHHFNAAFKIGMILHQQGRLTEALASLDLCKGLQEDHVATLHMRALVLHGLQRYAEALADNRRAHALDTASAHICNNLGHDLMQLGRYEEALPWLEKAIAIRPDFVVALNNHAFSLWQLHRFDDALAVYRRSRAFDPTHAETAWSLALLQMLLGNFEAGWAGREARFRLPSPSVTYPKFTQPQWFGESGIGAKTILLFADEGLGDSIQFARYVPMVAARGARVVLAVEESVRPLLSGIPGVAKCLAKSEPLPAFDLYCPLSSLPLAFRTTLDSIPAASYLPAPADDRVRAWEYRLGAHDRLRVGLAWSGNPKHVNDHNRSIPLRRLCKILEVDAMFVSLQKDPRPDDHAALLATDIIDLTAHFTNFVETAAMISCLDLVITVDTSVAHLAGALGRPTWILLPYTPDYRWLLGRDDSPWYPSARLFRQNETREYDQVLGRLRTELAALASDFSRN